ncbi:MAG: glycoside hydrolase family 18, partial [Bacilli bacterium]|nr:glycoside hydrolase family 18 [Bacilli bacterium]
LNYATSVIDPSKILMGMALYGYDWPLPHPSAGRAAAISNNNAQNLAIREQSPIGWNERQQSPFFRYTAADGRQHEVWFEDSYSAMTKMQLVYEMGLRGVSYWVLGNDFPQNWHLLRDNFNIRKF